MGEVRSEILQRWGRFSRKGQLQPGGKGRPTFRLEKEACAADCWSAFSGQHQTPDLTRKASLT